METLCRTLTTGRPAPTTIGLIMIKRSRLIMIMVMMASIDVIFCVSGLHSEKPPEEPRWPLLERRCQPLRRHYWGESEVTPSWERMQLPSKNQRRWNQMWVQPVASVAPNVTNQQQCLPLSGGQWSNKCVCRSFAGESYADNRAEAARGWLDNRPSRVLKRAALVLRLQRP